MLPPCPNRFSGGYYKVLSVLRQFFSINPISWPRCRIPHNQLKNNDIVKRLVRRSENTESSPIRWLSSGLKYGDVKKPSQFVVIDIVSYVLSGGGSSLLRLGKETLEEGANGP